MTCLLLLTCLLKLTIHCWNCRFTNFHCICHSRTRLRSTNWSRAGHTVMASMLHNYTVCGQYPGDVEASRQQSPWSVHTTYRHTDTSLRSFRSITLPTSLSWMSTFIIKFICRYSVNLSDWQKNVHRKVLSGAKLTKSLLQQLKDDSTDVPPTGQPLT